MNFGDWMFNEAVADLLKVVDRLPTMPRNEIHYILRSGTSGGRYSDDGRWADDAYKKHIDRHDFVRKYSWSIPCKEAIDTIKKYARPPLYDLMAGTGYWAKILNDAGVKTYASDMHLGRYNPYKHDSSHIKIRRKNAIIGAYSIQRARNSQGWHGDILLSWPPYESSTPTDILDTLPVGTRVFYLGEGYGGCTGDVAMHTNFNKNFKELEEVYLPKFEGLHDSLIVYEKIANNQIDTKLKGRTFPPRDDDDNDGT